MELIHTPPGQAVAIALGKFDGLHIGHIRLLEHTAVIAREQGLYPLAYMVRQENQPALLGNGEKFALLARCGMAGAYFQELNDAFRRLSPRQFVEEILIRQWRVAHIVVGFNFRFGNNRAGDTAMLRSLCRHLGVGLTVIDPVQYGGEAISSTRVRQAVEAGNMAEAAALLGRPYALCGKVEPGKRLGREIGFPTVNLYPEQALILPRRGVYVTRLVIDGNSYPAMTNVGLNPTVEHITQPKIETHVLDFHRELYGEQVRVEFLSPIRAEQAFPDLEALKAQLTADVQAVRQYFNQKQEG